MTFSLFSLAIKHHFFLLNDIQIFIKSHIWLIWLLHDWIESGAGRGRQDESPKFWRTDRVLLTFFWLIHTVHLYVTRVGRSASALEPNLAWAELQSSTAVTQNRPCCQLLHNTLFCFRLISRFIYTFERDTLNTSPSLVLPFHRSVTKRRRFAGPSLWFNNKCLGSLRWLEEKIQTSSSWLVTLRVQCMCMEAFLHQVKSL